MAIASSLPQSRGAVSGGIIRLLVAAVIGALGACGGGGGSDSGGSSSGLDTNACGTVGLNTKIINGTACEPAGSPIVQINLYDRSGDVYLCSGSVVTDRHVLTAGHCFLSTENPVEIESASISSSRGEIFASTITVPRNYSETPDAVFNDVAVLGFNRSLGLPTLPLIASRKVVANDIIAIYGYGQDNDGKAGTLKSGEMLIDSVTPNHLISLFGSAGSNTCFGDSGGPAVLQYTDAQGSTVTGIVGVTSSGSLETCTSGDRSLFANTQEDPVLDFLKRSIPGLQVK
jgi:secreted trypsin-like serine protease